MDEKEKEKARLDLLMKEADTTGQGIRTILLTSERIIALGLTISGAGLAYGIKEKIYDVLLFLPVAVIGVFIYGTALFTELMSLGGYKKHLEEKINRLLGQNILLWESSIAHKRHSAFVKVALYIIYSLFLALTIYVSLSTALKYYVMATVWGLIILDLIMLIFLGITLIKMVKTFDETYLHAKSQWLE
jgi:hypothetical protein